LACCDTGRIAYTCEGNATVELGVTVNVRRLHECLGAVERAEEVGTFAKGQARRGALGIEPNAADWIKFAWGRGVAWVFELKQGDGVRDILEVG